MRILSVALGVVTACQVSPRVEEKSDVVARIGARTLRRSEVTRGIAMEIYRREVDIYSLVKRELERRIEETLVEEEASRRGVSQETMLDDEIMRRVSEVTDAAVDAYLTEHGKPPERRGRVRAYLEGKARIEARLAFVEELRKKAGVEVLLEPPSRPRVEVDLAGAPSRGPVDAPVTVVHFASFTDPRSAETAKMIAAQFDDSKGKLRWVHRNVVLPGDESGLLAVALGRLAHERGKFWDVHDALFDALRPLDTAKIHDVAQRFGFTRTELDTALRDPARLASLREELKIAQRNGVIAPPVAFVNGRWFQGTLGRERFDALVREERATPFAR